jgi:DNA modification methylase
LVKVKIGRQALIQADCFDVLPKIARNSIDAIVTDPPYAVATAAANGGRRQNNKLGPNQCDAAVTTVGDLSLPEASYRNFFSEVLRILKPTGRIFIFCNSITYSILLRASYGRFASVKCLVWDKTAFGIGGEFRPQHELIFYARCGKAGTGKEYTKRGDVLRYKAVPPQKRLHSAQKPVELLQLLMTHCGRLILDPFMGSGSTLEACARTNRVGVGIEIDHGAYDVAVQRLRNLETR